MAPQSRKRKSEAMEDQTPQPSTPTGSPAHKRMKITAEQKQTLIDNLQLEITERARHLRAHYALQCADLRSRIERRINRIPIAMRKMTMRELMEKHAAASIKPTITASTYSQVTTTQERPLPALPAEPSPKSSSPIRLQSQAPTRGRKRKSSAIQIASDKDSEESVPDSLPIAKKTRGTKTTTTTAPSRTTSRAVSRTKQNNNVLSPRSHNSRTLPRSPLKDPQHISPFKPSPTKSLIARPISPLKPTSPFKSAASAISTAAHGVFEQAKRGAHATTDKLSRPPSREKITTANRGKMLPPPRPTTISSPQRTTSASSTHTTSSSHSSTSTSTTIITKAKRGARAGKATPATSPAASGAKATTASRLKKANTAAGAPLKTAAGAKGANKKVMIAEPAAGRRVLRSRKA